MKRVVFLEPRKIQIEEVSKPKRKPNEALLRVHFVGICGSDLHTYRGTSPLVTYPVVPGHELCCEVIESDEKFIPGDLVVIEPLLSCGRCYPCRIGRYNCCEQLKVLGVHTGGGMAEEIALPLKHLHRLPNGVDPSYAPLVETLSIGYHACNRGRVEREDKVLIIGAGPIGLGAALVAKERGAKVGMIDPLESRLQLSQELGIDFTFPLNGEMESRVISKFGCRPNVILEAVGSPKTLEQSLEMVSAAGRVVFVGWTTQSPQWRPDFFLKKELDLMGSRNSCGIFTEVVDFYCRNLAKVKRLVTHRFKMKEIEKAMNLIDGYSVQTMKVILEW
jgi:2-desacetyl-2-hydroxyethyl bacteriochlorophyllide A dehydrogenase